MATFSENIRKIRGEAITGPQMRTAIADAILQAIDVNLQEIDIPYPDGQTVYVQINPIEARTDDYLLSIENTT